MKGERAEAFIKVLGVCLKAEWIEQVLVNPNPFHGWGEGKIEGDVVDAAELHAHLKRTATS